MPGKIKVFIADDHPIFRQGLIKILESDSCHDIIGNSGDGMEAYQKISELRPDVAILDISMPGMDGLAIVRKVREDNLPIQFIILTMYKDEAYFNEALRLGVRGYLLKENTSKELLNCIHAILDGKHYVCADLTEYLLNRKEAIDTLEKEHPQLTNLTDMERRILSLIAENKTSKEIADQLFISHRTVQNHRAHISEKLGFSGYNKLLQFALENKSYL